MDEINEEVSEYKIDTSIDKHSLDDEWVKQADLFWKYSKLANTFFNAYNAAKNNYNVRRAEIEYAVRSGKIPIGIKITDKAVASFLDTEESLVALQNDIAEKKFHYEMYNSAVFAMEHKKRALEYITKLHLSNYFAESDYDKYRSSMQLGQ